MPMLNPSHPGEILREEFLKPLGLTVTATARALGVSRKVLSDIVNERAGVSPAMAIRLARAFDSDASFWLRLQNGYDLAHAATAARKFRVKPLYKAA